MRIISRKRLRDFWMSHPDSEQSLKSWCKLVEHSRWQTPQDVTRAVRTADVMQNGRMVFDIRDNRFRLVVKFHFNTGLAYVRFVGTHKEYNEIDANTV